MALLLVGGKLSRSRPAPSATHLSREYLVTTTWVSLIGGPPVPFPYFAIRPFHSFINGISLSWNHSFGIGIGDNNCVSIGFRSTNFSEVHHWCILQPRIGCLCMLFKRLQPSNWHITSLIRSLSKSSVIPTSSNPSSDIYYVFWDDSMAVIGDARSPEPWGLGPGVKGVFMGSYIYLPFIEGS